VDRVRGFLTLRLERLARGGIGKRLLQLGLRLLRDVGVLECGHRVRDRRLQRREVGGEGGGGELLEELVRRRSCRLIRALLQRVVARLELGGGLIELLLDLIARLEVGRAEILELGNELRRRSVRVVELLAERVRGAWFAAGVRERRERVAPVLEARADGARPLLGGRRAVIAQAHRDRGDDDRHDAERDGGDEPVSAHRRASLVFRT
jgi:hypothetical protein